MDAMAQWEQRYFLQLAKQWAAANGDELDPNFLLVPRLGEGVRFLLILLARIADATRIVEDSLCAFQPIDL